MKTYHFEKLLINLTFQYIFLYIIIYFRKSCLRAYEYSTRFCVIYTKRVSYNLSENKEIFVGSRVQNQLNNFHGFLKAYRFKKLLIILASIHRIMLIITQTRCFLINLGSGPLERITVRLQRLWMEGMDECFGYERYEFLECV